MNRPPKAKSIERLQKALDEIHELKQRPSISPQLEKWYRNTAIAIAHTFEEGRYVEHFTSISYVPRMKVVGKTHDSKSQQFVTTKPRLGSWLKRNGHRLKRPKMTAGKRETSIYTP